MLIKKKETSSAYNNWSGDKNPVKFGALLTNLSKDFNCLSQELLAAKVIAYGVEISFVRLIYDYLTNKGLRTKVGNNYSSWRNIPL